MTAVIHRKDLIIARIPDFKAATANACNTGSKWIRSSHAFFHQRFFRINAQQTTYVKLKKPVKSAGTCHNSVQEGQLLRLELGATCGQTVRLVNGFKFHADYKFPVAEWKNIWDETKVIFQTAHTRSLISAQITASFVWPPIKRRFADKF
jgi:hypothetical protein